MNRDLFQTRSTKRPAANALNSERAPAYAFSAAHALAQYAATGCLNQTFYASAGTQMETVLSLADQIPSELVAKIALWSRQCAYMKDLPALLAAYLTVRDPALADRIFERVIDDVKMLRNFVQIVRSGAVARRSLASMPKRLVRRWLDTQTSQQLFRASIGDQPSLGDVIRMAHPRPGDEERSATFAYLIGKKYDEAKLPPAAREFERWKRAPQGEPPMVPSAMLTSLALDSKAWCTIATRASWQETRMNLNTYARHGVFRSKNMTRAIAHKLRSRELLKKTRVMPYQVMTAYFAAKEEVPAEVKEALHDALDIALENMPPFAGKVFVCLDVSGSMQMPITGRRKGATTSVRCVDVAALMASSLLRTSDARVLPFEHRVVPMKLARSDTVLANAKALASIGGGGTNCSAPLAMLNAERAKGDLVIFVSDNESWVDAGLTRLSAEQVRLPRRLGTHAQPAGATALMDEWDAFKDRNPRAKLVCIDLIPNRTTQALDQDDVLNVGGFSDAVFEVIRGFVEAKSASHWIERVRDIAI